MTLDKHAGSSSSGLALRFAHIHVPVVEDVESGQEAECLPSTHGGGFKRSTV